MKKDAIFELSNVWKTYCMKDVETHALRGVDLKVDRGEYALNPVGYNLAAYGLPRTEASSPPVKRGRKRAKKKVNSKTGNSSAKSVSRRRR